MKFEMPDTKELPVLILIVAVVSLAMIWASKNTPLRNYV